MTRYRRASCLILFFAKERLVCENYLTGRRSALPQHFAELLATTDVAGTRDEIIGRWGIAGAGTEIFQAMLDHALLLEIGSPLETKDADIDDVWAWDVEAKYFHFATSLTRFQVNDEAVLAELDKKAQTEPAPSPYKHVSGPLMALPPAGPLPLPLGEALVRRRTCREFDGSIALDDLTSLLWWTWGRQREIRARSIGDVLLKTSPSGGSRHPIEVYVVCDDVAGVERGLYHYAVDHHALRRLPTDRRNIALDGCFRQLWVGDAAASFVMTAMLPRTMWKYRQAHALRVVLMEAGHLGQTFHLVATALGLGPFTTAALDTPLIERELGIDGVSEVPLYLASVGPPRKTPVERNVAAQLD